MRIFNADQTVLFSLETGKNWRSYSTNIRDGSKSIKIHRIWKKIDLRPKFRKQVTAVIKVQRKNNIHYTPTGTLEMRTSTGKIKVDGNYDQNNLIHSCESTNTRCSQDVYSSSRTPWNDIPFFAMWSLSVAMALKMTRKHLRFLTGFGVSPPLWRQWILCGMASCLGIGTTGVNSLEWSLTSTPKHPPHRWRHEALAIHVV
jgi:hypothetical protein